MYRQVHREEFGPWQFTVLIAVQNLEVFVTLPSPRHAYGVTTTVQLDGSNRIVLPLELRRAAGMPRGQRLKASATPGRIVLEVGPTTRGEVVQRGKLKLWTGAVPSTPLADAVEVSRHYDR